MHSFEQLSTTPESFIQLVENLNASLDNEYLLKLLGDFWMHEYTEYPTIRNYMAAIEELFSHKFSDLNNLILSSGIVSIPKKTKLNFSVMIFEEDSSFMAEDGSYIGYSLDKFSTFFAFESIKYVASNLLQPKAILDGTKYESPDFEVDLDENIIKFYVDIFNDEDFLKNCSYLDNNGKKVIMLWAADSIILSDNIQNRFGIYYGLRGNDSEDFYNKVLGVHYFFTNQKSIDNLDSALNILFGAPFCYNSDPNVYEQVISVVTDPREGPLKISTVVKKLDGTFVTSKDYPVVENHTVLVENYEILKNYQILSKIIDATDWTKTPNWYDGVKFPSELILTYETKAFLNWYRHYAICTDTYLHDEFLYDGTVEYGNIMPLVRAKYHGYSPWYYDGYTQYSNNTYTLFDTEAYYGKKCISDHNLLPSRHVCNELEAEMYDLIHSVLKYNLVYIRKYAETPIEIYKSTLHELIAVFPILRDGVPTQLLPIIEEYLCEEKLIPKGMYTELGELLICEEDNFPIFA